MTKTILTIAITAIVLIGGYVVYDQLIASDDAIIDTNTVIGDDMTDIWICENDQWVKRGNPSGPKPIEACGEAPPSSDAGDYPSGDAMLNWSTMNEGPYNDSVTYALSTDLMNWNASGKILATHSSVPAAVVKDDTIFVYFVDVSTDGIPEQLGMVRSDDEGATWSTQTTLTIEGLGDKAPADPAPVLLDDGRIRLFYFDINEARVSKPASGIEPPAKIYSAISSDGVNFVQEDGIRFQRAAGVYDPDVELFDGTWYLYGGVRTGDQVIYATSTDGLTFTEQGVAYNGGGVPDVFTDGATYYLYTAGINIATGVEPTSFTDMNMQFRDEASGGATADPSVLSLNNEFFIMFYKIQGNK